MAPPIQLLLPKNQVSAPSKVDNSAQLEKSQKLVAANKAAAASILLSLSKSLEASTVTPTVRKITCLI